MGDAVNMRKFGSFISLERAYCKSEDDSARGQYYTRLLKSCERLEV